MSRNRILVIEDQLSYRRGLSVTLRKQGYEVQVAEDCSKGYPLALAGDFDLLILDLSLPDGDGLDILAGVRRVSPAIPIIILSARGEPHERILGLKSGADDYVTKSFSGLPELMARIEALLRRSPTRPKPESLVAIPRGVVDLTRAEVHFDTGEVVPLSERETELLAFFCHQPREVLSRDDIFAGVWRLDPVSFNSRTVDFHIVNLRKKLRDDPDKPRIIRTHWGKGYEFTGADAPLER